MTSVNDMNVEADEGRSSQPKQGLDKQLNPESLSELQDYVAPSDPDASVTTLPSYLLDIAATSGQEYDVSSLPLDVLIDTFSSECSPPTVPLPAALLHNASHSECDTNVGTSPSEPLVNVSPFECELNLSTPSKDLVFPSECDTKMTKLPSEVALHSSPSECDTNVGECDTNVGTLPSELLTITVPSESDVAGLPSELLHHASPPESEAFMKMLPLDRLNNISSSPLDDSISNLLLLSDSFTSGCDVPPLPLELFHHSSPIEYDAIGGTLGHLNNTTTSECDTGFGTLDPLNNSTQSECDTFFDTRESLNNIIPSEFGSGFGMLDPFSNITSSECDSGLKAVDPFSNITPSDCGGGFGTVDPFSNITPSDCGGGFGTVDPFSNITPSDCDNGLGTVDNIIPPEHDSGVATLPVELLNSASHARFEHKVASLQTEEQYVLAIDIGTSSIRGHIYNKLAHIKGTASKQQQLLKPEPGWSEIDPKKLLEDVCAVAQDSIRGLQPDQITCMGITTLRATFLTWDRETGEPLHNLITWQDLRAAAYVFEWNRSYALHSLNIGAKILYKLFRKKRHLAGSVLKFMSKQVTLRLLWVFDNIPEVRKRASARQVMFGCAESWLLWKLTREKKHVTDFSCASATGLFDPFQMEWSTIVCGLLNIPMYIFPEVQDTSGDFGVTDPDVFGFEIPITAVVADQQGSMFGQCCFNLGDVKCTMGTGTFLDLNTGRVPHASIAGLYPIIGWKIGSELVFVAEGQCADTGIVIEWAKTLGLLDDVADSSDLAESVPDSGGVFFVPAFSGLQAPFNDDAATTAMFGMTPSTTKAHMVRAVLESLVFRFRSLYEAARHETSIPFSRIRVDGGAGDNDFLVQMMSDIVDQVIERGPHSDMSCLGAAFLAGLAKGVWANKEELQLLRQSDKLFEPRKLSRQRIEMLYQHWKNAVGRSQNWYSCP